MEIIKQTGSFLGLAERLKSYPPGQLHEVFEKARIHNPWFTHENTTLAFEGLFNFLEARNLEEWLSKYQFGQVSPKTIGVVMAGNIPLVGIHDALCVLLSGHRLLAKLSSQDKILIPFVLDELIKLSPAFRDRIEYTDRLKNFDAVIATGSNNSARYFEYYFSSVPHIIRKNRVSVGVLNGHESTEQIEELSKDIFQYFGLGCRSVSKIFVPQGYDLASLLEKMPDLQHLTNHHKYANNYYYNKSIYLVNMARHYDNGYALFTQNQQLASPIAVVYYDFYESLDSVNKIIGQHRDSIQCVVSDEPLVKDRIALGMAQKPAAWDYADNVDTMEFLASL